LVRVADLRGYSRLAVDAAIGLANLVETMHHNILRTPGIFGKSTQQPAGGITGFVYKSIRGVTRVVGGGIDAVLARLVPLFDGGASSSEREAVLAALVQDEVSGLIARLAPLRLPDALAGAANELAHHPVLRTLARIEPATLARLGCVDTSAEGWRLAREGVAAALTRGGRAGTDTVLRWLASYLLTPASAAAVADDLAIVLAGLPDAPAAASSAETARTA